LAIAFPDEGAWKRFGKSLSDNDLPQIVCSKVRGENDSRKVTIKEGDCTGRHVFIVDDLVRTGGTLKECRKALREAGAEKVSCFVTHAVFPPEKKTQRPTWKSFRPYVIRVRGSAYVQEKRER
jgi:phosphoribosylpyrophosphate synthetase